LDLYQKTASRHPQIRIPAIADFNFEDQGSESAWLLLSDAHEDFETAANQLCELITLMDYRIGNATLKATRCLINLALCSSTQKTR